MTLRASCAAAASLLIYIGVAVLAGCSQTPTEAKSPVPAPPTLEFVAQFGVRGGGPGQLSEPVSIASDLLSNVYIADAGSQFIHKFGCSPSRRMRSNTRNGSRLTATATFMFRIRFAEACL